MPVIKNHVSVFLLPCFSHMPRMSLMWRIVAEQLRAPDSACGVSDQQSVGWSPGHDTCVLEQDALPYFLCPLDGTLSCRSRALGLVVLVKETQNTYRDV